MRVKWLIAGVATLLGARVALAQAAARVSPESLEQGFTIVVEDRSGLGGVDAVYLGSNLVNWNPADPAMRLRKRADGRWEIALPKQTGALEFKFTRGSWETVEVSADLTDLVNRRLALLDPSKLKPGERPTVELAVERWADQRPDAQARRAIDSYHEMRVTGDLRRVQVPGGGGISLVRDLLVWLPPGYDDPANRERRYPVLYLQDGQNLFEKHPGIPAEWLVDETATELVKAGEVEALIIVGIPHAGPYRISEYVTQPGLRGQEPHGDDYTRWLIERVMPRVEGAFRVAKGPERTAIGGSSLGGLVALHAATRHPEVFGMVLAESPTLVFDRRPILQEEFGSVQRWPGRVYIGMGGKEVSPDPGSRLNLDHLHAAKTLNALLRGKLAEDSLRLVVELDAEHTEEAWACRFPAALKFLFPAAGGH